MGIPYHPWATVDGLVRYILSRQIQNQSKVSKRKILATLFRDRRGVFLVDFMPHRTAISSGAYCAILEKLRRPLQNKRRGMLSKRMLLLNDYVRPHTSRTTIIEYFSWKVLDHTPYIPQLAPSNFYFFRYIKHHFGLKRFSDNEREKAAVNSSLSEKAADFCEEGFLNLGLMKEKCINKLGNYVEN